MSCAKRSGLLVLLVLLQGACHKNAATAPQDCTNADETRCGKEIACTPDVVRCAPRLGIQRCRADGQGWDDVAQCDPSQNCTGGQCSPAACTPGQLMCTPDGKVSACTLGLGTYSLPVKCPVGQTCIGTSCVPTLCNPNQRYCEGDRVVRECDALGGEARVAETCQGNAQCSGGACKDPCIAAQDQRSFAGCEFFAIDTDNSGPDDGLQNDIVVANTSADVVATVKLQLRSGQMQWTDACTAQVAPQTVHVFVLNGVGCTSALGPFAPHEDKHVENSALVPAGAYRITSDAPIVSYFFNSDDLDRAAASSGATVLFPTHTLGKRYLAASLPDISTAQHAEGGPAHAFMAVVGTVDGTDVTVTASTNLQGGSGIMPMIAAQTQRFTIGAGEVLQLETSMDGDDLTGSLIDASQPVAVFVGHECASGGRATGVEFCDHIEEALLPLQAWGKNYVAPRLIPNGDADDEPTLWQILASEDGTTVTATAPAGVTLEPAGPYRLDAGQQVTVTARGQCTNTASCFSNLSQPPGDFFLGADKPILLMQYTMGEPSSVTAVPVEQYLPKYQFVTPGFFCSQLAVIRKAGTRVELDGVPLDDSIFVPAGGDFEVGRVREETLTPSCPSQDVRQHTVTVGPTLEGKMNPAGIAVRGADGNCSYGYVGGLSVEVINPIGIQAPP